MANLIDTHNLTKARRLTTPDGLLTFTEIPAIGDGNCGWYAFALAIMHLVKSNQLVLSNETYAELLAAIRQSFPLLKERVKLYRNDPSARVQGNAYTDMAPYLERVIGFFASEEAKTFAGFKHWLDAVNPRDVRFHFAAMHVALGPALRKIGVERSLPGASVLRAQQLKELKHDGVDADQEILEKLAHDVFHINLDTYHDEKHDGHLVNTNLVDDIPRAPHAALVHVPGHWNFLLPPGEQGLACLPHSHSQAPVRAAARKNEPARLMGHEELLDISQSLEALGNDLLKGPLPDNDTLINAAAHSQRLINNTLKKLNVTESTLKKLGLRGMALELVLQTKEVMAPPASSDEAIARALQNAEITAFLNSNYATLASGKLAPAPKKETKIDHAGPEKTPAPRNSRA